MAGAIMNPLEEVEAIHVSSDVCGDEKLTSSTSSCPFWQNEEGSDPGVDDQCFYTLLTNEITNTLSASHPAVPSWTWVDSSTANCSIKS